VAEDLTEHAVMPHKSCRWCGRLLAAGLACFCVASPHGDNPHTPEKHGVTLYSERVLNVAGITTSLSPGTLGYTMGNGRAPALSLSQWSPSPSATTTAAPKGGANEAPSLDGDKAPRA
jgi:hypothetical protein